MAAKLLAGAFITNTIDEITKMAMSELIRQLNPKMAAIANSIQVDLQNSVPLIFQTSPEYKSIANGMLQAHFGLRPDEAENKVKSIVDTLAKSVKVDFTKLSYRGGKIVGGFRFYAFQADFNDILSLDAATQVTDSGQTLPWLEWLLLEGDKVIIYDYFFLPGNFKSSRSNKGIMVMGNTKYWRVPPLYSGIASDNWITRTVNAAIIDIETIIEQILKRYL